MKVFLIQVVIALFVVTLVAALVFRSRRAWDVLHLLRRIGWVYVVVIVIVAAYRLWT